MAIRNIREDGDEVLRKVCKPVEVMTERLSTLIDDMFETMYEANGVGLAAPQVGVLRRIVVIDVMDDNPLVLVNPEIIEKDGEQIGPEGCLSLPGLQGDVARPEHVVCKALDRDMKEITVEGEGLLARAICHELDHLDGILYKDLAIGGLYKVEPIDPEEEEEE
ncbi:MAG: peptide deformylase [Eubacterium sp.]|nr:peptide deformylase [Eubacterium sp.]MEE3400107.1 peptide deformylase [Eubacterium sp.]